MSGELEEREWTDERGTHYEAKIVTANGFIVSKQVTMFPHAGWGTSRADAARDVQYHALRAERVKREQ